MYQRSAGSKLSGIFSIENKVQYKVTESFNDVPRLESLYNTT